MEMFAATISIAGAVALGAISPGPSFVMVARTALAKSRKEGLSAAVGMGVGGAFFAAVAVLGLHALFAAVPSLYVALRVLGGGYLLYFGYRLWRGARQPMVPRHTPPQESSRSAWRSFALGLVTQVSNPKTAVVFASVFASLLPREVPPSAVLWLPVMIFVIETTWYSFVAIALSALSPRACYLGSKARIDRAAGCVMSALGAKLVVEVHQS